MLFHSCKPARHLRHFFDFFATDDVARQFMSSDKNGNSSFGEVIMAAYVSFCKGIVRLEYSKFLFFVYI